MVKKVSIEHFKSIRHVEFSCSRINIFIGEPNVGKSNILEALGLFSAGNVWQPDDFRELFRFQYGENLFYDNDITRPVEIKADNFENKIWQERGAIKMRATEGEKVILEGVFQPKNFRINEAEGDSGFKFFKFKNLENYGKEGTANLRPPHGENLFSVLKTHPHFRELVKQILQEKGIRLLLRDREREIEIVKDFKETLISYPYSSLSDTLKRVIFYMAILETCRDSALLFEEPESYTFPEQVTYLAERIAMDEADNQFFIVTHSRDLISAIHERCLRGELSVFAVFSHDHETKIQWLKDEELDEIYHFDIIGNLHKLVEA